MSVINYCSQRSLFFSYYISVFVSSQKDVPLKKLWSLVREIDYFAYLILIGEIKDKDVLRYYKVPLSQYIENILKYYAPADQRYYLYLDYGNFRELIKKWDINRPDEEMP
jgi:hypothetical protein